MKLSTILYGIVFVSVFWLVLPFSFLTINNLLNYPEISSGLLKISGILLLVVDVFILLYCSFLFITYGKGTPVPSESPKKLVRNKLYNFTRNPIYIGHILGILGIAFIFGKLLLFVYFILFVVLVNCYLIFIEEPKLKKKFGKSYLEYLKKVKRWGLF